MIFGAASHRFSFFFLFATSLHLEFSTSNIYLQTLSPKVLKIGDPKLVTMNFHAGENLWLVKIL